MDIRKVKKLIELMEESDIHEIEVKEGDDAVRITRRSPEFVALNGQTTNVETLNTVPGNVAPAANPPVSGHVIRAPMVGTFYLAPSPGSPPFVQVGDRVKAGDTLCIIESMKMMNQIESDKNGVVEAVLISNEQSVEYDQPLFTIV